jgi:drug/metabolite transporter (DMT)-like permease
LIGGIFLTAVGLILGGKLTHVDGVAAAALTYICIASIVAYVIWNSLLKNANMSMLSVIKFAEPLFACLFGALLLGEDIFKWQYLVALLLISVGIVISNKKTKEKVK